MEIIDSHQKPFVKSGYFAKTNTILQYFKFFLLPALSAVFPTLFFYGNNVHELMLEHLTRTALTYLLLSVVVYLLFLAFYRKSPFKAATATLIFMVFFNFYGILEGLLIRLDWFPVRFYTTLPLSFLLVFYSIWLVNKLNDSISKNLWNVGVVFFAGLVVINLVTIVPAELMKAKTSGQQLSKTLQVNLTTANEKPDIYYILLDEFSGFEPMRDYWLNSKVEDFAGFLKTNGFEIFDDSHGSSIDSIHQMVTRLNFQIYPFTKDQETRNQWFNAVADNKVMSYLKEVGYTTITFNELLYPYPAAKPITADVAYNYGDIPSTNLSVFFDDFWILVADKTMLKELSHYYKTLGSDQHSNFIFFTAKKIGDLDDASSPKFVYAHLMLPHAPFMFDENGKSNPPSTYKDYEYYVGNYNFTILLVKKMVNEILMDADPENPPVIILQSDHGLRNFAEYQGQLENFPEEYKTSILYARLIPGYQSTGSAQESDPINTFPILFNYLFDAGIPLQ